MGILNQICRETIRIMAFWDKTDIDKTLVLVTNDFIKKNRKHRLEKLKERKEFAKNFEEKEKNNKNKK